MTILFCFVMLLASSAVGQTSDKREAQPALATVTIQVAKKAYKAGDAIDVTILLAAGPGGVYIAKGWGSAGGAIPGFLVKLKTMSGKNAETCGLGGDAFASPRPDLAEYLHKNFILLRDGEIVGLRTAIRCPSRRHGKYRIEANYSPRFPGTKEVAQLAETEGLVLTEVITAKPVEISIY